MKEKGYRRNNKAGGELVTDAKAEPGRVVKAADSGQGNNQHCSPKEQSKKTEYTDLGITRKQAAGCETAPLGKAYAGRKIIPFPGVTLRDPDHFENGLVDFLKTVGYIE